MPKVSPTQRSMALLRKEGSVFQVVERWNAFARRRIDLFGCIDIVCIHPTRGIIGIQATSGTNHSARISKSLAEPKLKNWLEAGGKFEVWSWAKKGAAGKAKRWTCRIQPISLNEGVPVAGD